MTRQLLLATAAYWYSADLNNLMDNSSRFSGPAILGGFGAVSERGPDEVWRGPSRPPALIFLGAAQPQPNDRGELNAFVPGLALRRAALNGATPSPTGDMRLRSVVEQLEGNGLEQSPPLRSLRKSSKISCLAFNSSVSQFTNFPI